MQGVLIVAGPIPPPVHGASRVTAAFAEAASDAGFEVEIFNTAPTSSRSMTGWRRWWPYLACSRRLLTCKAGRTRLYIGGAGGVTLYLQFFLVVCARWRGVNVWFHHHSRKYLTTRGLAMSLVCKLEVHHICLNALMRTDLIRLYEPQGSCAVLSNAAFVDVSSRVQARERVRAVHVSNLSREKGVHRVLEVVERLGAEHVQGVTVVLAGPANARNLAEIELVQRRHGHVLEYLGPLDREGVERTLSTATVFLFPSQYPHEAQPLVVLEAAAHGVPTLAVDTRAMRGMLPAHNLSADGRFSSFAVSWLREALQSRDPAASIDAERHRYQLANARARRDLLALLEKIEKR